MWQALGECVNKNNSKIVARYVNARVDAWADDINYRIYVTDMLKIAPENKTLGKRWIDQLPSIMAKKIKERPTVDQIIDQLKQGGIKVIEHESA